MSDRGSPEEGYAQRGHRHILPGSAHKTPLCPFNLIAEGSLLKPRKRPGCIIWDLYLCWFATGYLSEQYWDHGQVLVGECGSQHMMTPLFAVAPCSGYWGLNLKPWCDFGQAIWRVKSQSPHLYHRKASSLGYWEATGDSACERLAHRKCSETWAIIVMTKMRFQRMVLKGSMHDCPIDILTKGSQTSKIVLEAPECGKFHSFAKEYNVSFYRRIIHFG